MCSLSYALQQSLQRNRHAEHNGLWQGIVAYVVYILFGKFVAGDSGASGRWSTKYCFAKKAFICKMSANATIAAVVGTPVTDGSLCHFPFRYRGQDFNTCTTYGSTYLWCATTDHYERDKKFAICGKFLCSEKIF